MKSKTLDIVNNNGLVYIRFPKLTACGKVRHFFSTRLGGVSTGQYSSVNLSFNNGDSRENVLENYGRLCNCTEISMSHLTLSAQTHTSNVISVTEEDIGRGIYREPFTDVDGMVTDRPGIALVTHFADCTPLIFCDPVKNVIASSHAGWRGTVKEIGRITVEKMIDEYGCRPDNIIAAIGPHIDRCCYEVDDPVAEEFRKLSYLGLDKILQPKDNGHYMLDLTEANMQILENAGINPNNIDVSDICTCCNSDELHSHRATGGKRGILAAVIELI